VHRIAVVSILTLVIAAPVVAQTKATRLVGWVSDGHCTTQHMKEGGEMCVRKCIAGATHVNPDWKPGGMVFVTEDKKVWKVDNPDALWGHESKRVEIEGATNVEKGSVHVAKFIGPKPTK
jgi:hypothetical protein